MAGGNGNRMRYLIVKPENGGIVDLFRFLVWNNRVCASKFVESSDDDVDDLTSWPKDHRWVIIVSIVMRKLIAVFGKPMEWAGYLFEFFLNLLSLNGDNLFALIYNFFRGKMVMPQRGSDTFISAIGHLDGRIDLDKNDLFKQLGDKPASEEKIGISMHLANRSLVDLSMMAAKLAYENANVVRNVVNQHWKMHFIDFYNCWNEFQKERSTQVFILCDKPKDADLILISFRGTEPFDADDWITDFDYSWYEFPKLGKVHMGFLEALGLGSRGNTATFSELLQMKSTKSTFFDPEQEQSSLSVDPPKQLGPEMTEMTAYFAVKSKLRQLLRKHKAAKFLVTGHSLGGALAILFPTVLVLHEEEEIMQRLLGVHTFGQPRIGDRQLGIFMEAHLEYPEPKYFRVVYCNDLVPRLPYDNKTWLYKHFGVCLYFNSLYVEQKVNEEPNKNYFGLRYLIPAYLNAGWELIRSFIMDSMYGPEYREGWLSILLRVVGLILPGISAHSPTNYVNSIRLGKMKVTEMSPL
ncbi:hypothetical protein DCAR_0730348 [Daucus carota subsp. sativus]|uniref:Fungal lipase-type domain-containing protein n=1 Tax=Daucus carota subsp. sativus TaxID=79200 RepID=A0A161YA61_DAUCS|nr:PREDICTED: uncharacterized protein LOC108193476 isoform X1 [Daucus carota subsp. sativus]WOH10873.1 hypothetical protein DCAR_0730348 [Daucus carota subsp. sativus]